MDWIDERIEEYFPAEVVDLFWNASPVRTHVRKLINEILIKVLSQGMQDVPVPSEKIASWKEDALLIVSAKEEMKLLYHLSVAYNKDWANRCLELMQVIEILLRKIAALMNDSDAYQHGYDVGLRQGREET